MIIFFNIIFVILGVLGVIIAMQLVNFLDTVIKYFQKRNALMDDATGKK